MQKHLLFTCASTLITSFYFRILLIPTRTTLAKVKSFNQTELEDMFVNHFGDNYTEFKGWYPFREWYLEDGEPKVRAFCKNAHKKSGKGAIDINVLTMRPRFVGLQNYGPKKVDIISYGFADPKAKNPDMMYWYTAEGKHWYITQGLKPDCVFYATLPNITLKVFKLIEYVCGIEIPK